jgi:UDP-N-acetylmuramate dehydrogenase
MNDLAGSVDLVEWSEAGVKLRENVSLAPFSTMKVGGDADYFASVAAMDALVALVRWCQDHLQPYFILGGGSNVLISDRGIRGLVIYNRCRQVAIEEERRGAADTESAVDLVAESGAAMAGAARTAVQLGLEGLEWAVSIPGTVGGAIVGNAGAHGSDTASTLYSALLLDERGEKRTLSTGEFSYGYRDGILKRSYPVTAGMTPVVLSGAFRLIRGDASAIRARADAYLRRRRESQPVEPNAGSIFMNPPGDYAGRIIEAAGLKGAQIGGAKVSEAHANFIVNVGNATAGDVLTLIEHVQETVMTRFGVLLAPEVQQVGEW